MKRKILFSIFLLALAATTFGQVQPDSSFLHTAIAHAEKTYRQAIGPQARLYNGSKYVSPEQTFEQHPYFSSEDWIVGDVFYDGELFRAVPLMFDLFGGHLITEHLTSGHPIQLIYQKLQRFSIAGHHFEKIEDQTTGLPHQGFYDVLYPGETKVLARRQKFLHEEIEASAIHVTYEQRNRYFIFKNGVYFPVNNKASTLKVLGDKKQELKKFLKEQHMFFSLDRELALKSLAQYYDQIR